MSTLWKQEERFVVAAGTTSTFRLKLNAPLTNLAIWASSGKRVINLTFQFKANDRLIGPGAAIAGRAAADLVYETAILPWSDPKNGFDALEYTLAIENADASAHTVTINAAATQHFG